VVEKEHFLEKEHGIPDPDEIKKVAYGEAENFLEKEHGIPDPDEIKKVVCSRAQGGYLHVPHHRRTPKTIELVSVAIKSRLR